MRCRRRRLWPARAGRLALAVVAGVSIATLLSDRSEVAGFQEPVEDSVAGRGADRGELVSQYCVGCHNERLLTGGLSLAAVAPAIDHSNAATWEKVVRKVRIGAMPPPGLPRPEAAAFEEFVVSLEADLDTLSEREPNPGRPLLRRVNRTEYGNAIRDLLDLDVDIATLLPPDDSAYGFDNIADVLVLSPVLVERYVTAAEKISALAVGASGSRPDSTTYRVRQDRSQDQHIEGLPLGTVGGFGVRHTFPADGEYVLGIQLLRTNTDSIRGLEYENVLEIAVDGERLALRPLGGGADIDAESEIEPRLQVRVSVAAGPRTITAAFLQERGVGTRRLQPFVRSSASPYDSTGRPHVAALTVSGPFNESGPGDTPSRRQVFVCRPGGALSETACAEQIMGRLARRAYRRDVTPGDLEPLLDFYRAGALDGGFELGVQRALQRMLTSPSFLLRIEGGEAASGSTGVVPVDDVELASRLSFFLWSSIPDEELLDVATRGELSEPGVLEEQLGRMLASERAGGLVRNFGGQWLQLRNLRNIVPDPERFPDFDDQLRQAFARETELLLETVIREDRSVLELLTADYTFVNERLARHYGIPRVYGTQFRRVAVTDEARRGLLGHGSLLTVTSHADRTAPVLRGKWVLDNLLGIPPPPPPPDVTTDLPIPEEGDEPKTIREQMEVHRASPVCASCHRLMDPIGLALENFDAVGGWRTEDAGRPIDASTQLFDGAAVDGAVALRAALLSREAVMVTTITEKLMTYALGRGLEYYDMPAVRAIVREAAHDDYRFSAVVHGIVTSVPFRMRQPES